MNLSHYAKYIIAILFTLVAAFAATLQDNHLTVEEGINVAILGGGAVVTYLVPNLHEGVGKYLKLIIQAITAGLVLLISLLVDGLTAGEVLQVGAAILGVFTVYAIPNAPALLAVDHGGNPVFQPSGR